MKPLPVYSNFTSISISSQGFTKLQELSQKSQYPGQHTVWTDDYRVELPIRLASNGIANIQPTTIVEEWKVALEKFGEQPALSVKRNNKWVTLTYLQYYQECLKFSRALISLGYNEFTVVNLIGFNSPEWAIAYFGTILARCIPVGIYATNSQTACHYIASHSEARMVVAQNNQYAQKYYSLLGKGLDKIVLYGESPKDSLNDQVVSWGQFMQLGKDTGKWGAQQLQRMHHMQPGNCITLIYTSGTTGMPKGVMLSHDNFIFTCKSTLSREPNARRSLRIVSYLPLSHAAGQFIDIYMALISGYHLFFADPSALTGSLVQTLQEVRPEAFFSVPRVWEKIYDKMMEIAKSNSGILAKIGTWAKSIGEQGTLQQQKGEQTSLQFKLAKKLVYNRVKAALGLDQCNYFVFGSAPLDPAIRKYFFSLNMFLRNGYGMTECTAPECSTNPHFLTMQKLEDYLQVGSAFPGTQMKIYKAKEGEQGQICMRGRNICMGYFKNAQDSSKIIDEQGFLHSGDLGRIKNGVLFITGRVKELIITAGGENIPPILIENQIKTALPCLANVMAIGDHRKYLTCLISLKQDPPQSGNIEKSAADFLASKGCSITKIKQAVGNPIFQKIIQEGLNKANTKAISRAQYVQDFHFMTEDFSIENGLLTPTLKLKRREAMKRYESQIQAMYTKAKL